MNRDLPDTRAFAPFEWMLALRYLRARRKEGFISVISLFSFLGILLGVATLIVVKALVLFVVAKVFGMNNRSTKNLALALPQVGCSTVPRAA